MSSLFDTTTRTQPARRLVPPSPDVAEWIAQQTLRMHREPPAEWCTGRCRQCPSNPAGCLHLAWAVAVVHAHQPQPAHGRTRP